MENDVTGDAVEEVEESRLVATVDDPEDETYVKVGGKVGDWVVEG